MSEDEVVPETRGVRVELLATVDLGPEIQGLEGHDVDWLEEHGKNMPLGRLQTPEDAAWGAVYLASDEASMVTGQALNVDGGGSIRW